MEKSESIKELSTALSKFQSEIHNPSNTAINPFFKSKYSPLNEVLNTVRPILSKYGLSVIQNNSGNGEGVVVSTLILHSSGEYIKTGELTARPEKNTAQAMGAIITYLRRYQISSLLGISSEDDNDGNETTKEKKEIATTPEIKELLEKVKLAGWDKNLDAILKTYKVKNINELKTEQIADLTEKCNKKIQEVK